MTVDHCVLNSVGMRLFQRTLGGLFIINCIFQVFVSQWTVKLLNKAQQDEGSQLSSSASGGKFNPFSA